MSKASRCGLGFVVLAVALACSWAQAKLELPAVYSDHAVIQRDMPVPVWGWADAGQTVTVTFKGQTAAGKADASGKWTATLKPLGADATPAVMTVQAGDETLTVSDLLVGEVWLCSGQSNMEWTLRRADNADAAIAASDDPLLRQIKAPHRPSTTPEDRVDASWQTATPASVPNWTAVGYFFGRDLRKQLDVPVGLINCSWGGTRIEPWTSRDGFKATPATASIYQDIVQRDPTSDAYEKIASEYAQSLEAWSRQAQAALRDNQPITPPAAFPAQLEPYASHQSPAMLFNGMLNPFVPYPIRGAIWYQGEANHGETQSYVDKTAALLAGWRAVWGEELPYYFVQIAPYQYGNSPAHRLPEFWEAQAKIEQTIPHTGMIVINDIGNPTNIHPANKQDVGKRLALRALRDTYGKTGFVAQGPRFADMQVQGDAIIVSFDQVGDGLKSRDGGPLTDFEICGKTRPWTAATAKIVGKNKVELTADGVADPVAMRFAWNKIASPNLVNSAGLPTPAFRAGTPGDYDPMLLNAPELKDYELVYELTLDGVGAEPRYAVDRAAEITGPFDRVAYYLELVKNGETQWVCVEMDPFTRDAKKLGVPTAASGARFQQKVDHVSIKSNVAPLPGGGDGLTASVEFWPNNYAGTTTLGLPGASSSAYDFDDKMDAGKPDGYGSMQVHLPGEKLTVFALNHWSSGRKADLGIGNNDASKHTDWTFTGSAAQYDAMRLRVLVRPAK